MLKKGYVNIHRKIWQSEIGKMGADAVGLAVYFICNASPKDYTRGNTIILRRGELKTALSTISKITKLSIQRIRTLITKFVSVGFIANHSTKRGRRIYVRRYEKYQYNPTNKVTNKQQTPPRLSKETYKETNKAKVVKKCIEDLSYKKQFPK